MSRTLAILLTTLPLVATACSVTDERAESIAAVGGGPSLANVGGEPPAFSPDRARGQLGRALCTRAAEACVAEASPGEERMCGMVATAALEGWGDACVLIAADALGACLADVGQSACGDLSMLPPTCDPSLLCEDAVPRPGL